MYDIDAILKAALAGRIGTAGGHSDEPQLPDLSPEERESLLSQVATSALGGLQYIGETLDKPGAAVRGLLGGQPEQLLNLIPFSDAMGITDPSERVSGRDLLERAGMLDENVSGLDMGDVAGFGVELVTDPLNLVGLGAGPKTLTTLGHKLAAGGVSALDNVLATGGAKAAEVAGENIPKLMKYASTPAEAIAGVRGVPEVMGEPLGELAGMGLREAMIAERARTGASNAPLRGIASFGLEGSPLGWLARKTGLADETTPFLGRNIVPKWATGEGPAKLMESLYYGKLSPVRAVRGLLSSSTGEQTHGAAQAIFDMGRAEHLYGMAGSIEKANALRKGYDGLKQTYEEMTKGMHPEDVDSLNNLLRSTAETADFSLDDVANKLSFLAGRGDLEAFNEEFYNLAGRMAQLPNEMAGVLRGQGLPLAMLDDAFVPYSPRRFNQALVDGTKEAFQRASKEYDEAKAAITASGLAVKDIETAATMGRSWQSIQGLEAAAEKSGLEPYDLFDRLKEGPPDRAAFEGRRFLTTHPWFSEARNKLWKDIPGGTVMANAISSIGWIVGRAFQPDIADAQFARFAGALPHAGGPRLSQSAFWAKAKDIGQQFGLDHTQLEERVRDAWDVAKLRHADASTLYNKAVAATGMKKRELELIFTKKGATPEQLEKLNNAAHELGSTDPMFVDRINTANPAESLLEIIKKGPPTKLYRNHAETLAEMEAFLEGRTYHRGIHVADPADTVPWGGRMFDKEGLNNVAQNIFGGTVTGDALLNAIKNTPMGPLPPGAADFALHTPTQYSRDIAAAYISQKAGIHITKAMEIVKRLEVMDPRVLEMGANIAEFDTLSDATANAKMFYDHFKGAREYAIVKKGDKYALMAPDGMYNRGLVEDTIDYMEHAYRVSNGLNSVNRVLSDPKIAIQRAEPVANNLQEAWTKMGLTEEGLINLLKKRGINVETAEDAMAAATHIEVPPEVVRGVTKFMRAHTQPDSMRGLLGFVDRWLASFKGGVTMPRIAFHVRNRISGMYANWQMGQWSARSEKWAMQLAKGKDIDMGKAGTMSAKELTRELGDYGILKHTPLYDIQGADTPITPPSILGALKGAFQEKTGEVTVKSVLRGINPLPIQGGFDVEGAFKKGASLKDRLSSLTHDTAEESRFFALKAGEAGYKKVEYYNRVAPYLELRAQGLTPAEAAQRVKMAQFDYADLTNFERQVMKRVIPFYCVPEDSEALTRDGWKHYTQIEFGDELLTYNTDRDRYEWRPCLEVASFQHDEELLEWKNKTHTLRFTPNHRWVAETPAMTVKRPHGTYGYPRRRGIVEGQDLTSGHSLLNVSEYHGEHSVLTPTQARLLGWLITDGYWRRRGKHVEAMIYQHPKKFLKEVLEVAGGNPRKQHPETGVVCVPVVNDRVKEIEQYLDCDNLVRVVTRLSREAMEAMYDAMYKGDGTVSPKRQSDYLAATKPEVREVLQILCTLLGKRCVLNDRGGYISHRRTMRLGMGKTQRVHYKGVVWCPRTENGTWVMRQGKLVTITGNTFSRKNLPFQLRMLLESPGGRTAQTVRAFNVTRDETKDTGFVPRYLAESLAIPLGGTPESRRYLSVSGTLPIEEALNHFAFTNNLPDLRRTAQKVGGQLNFMIQQPIESITDTQLWSGRRKSSLYQEPTSSPWLNALMYSGAVPMAVGLPTALSTGRPFFDERKEWWQGPASAVIGGVKVTDVNPNSRLLEARDILERTLPAQQGVGVFRRVYAKDVGRMTEDTAQKTALYNSIAKELQKSREKEMARKAKEKAANR